MKRYGGALVVLLLLGILGWLLWIRFHAPLGANVADAALRGGYLRGNLVNTGQQPIAHSDVEVTFTDATGKQVGTAAFQSGSLQPGQSTPLQLAAPPSATCFSISVESRAGLI